MAKGPNPALTASGDVLSSGGSRCYHHHCQPRQLAHLLPRAGGSRCRHGVGGTALGLSSMAPGQRLAALPKAPFPSSWKELLPDFVLKRLRWEHSCPILLTHSGGVRQQREGNNKQLEGVKGEVTS